MDKMTKKQGAVLQEQQMKPPLGGFSMAPSAQGAPGVGPMGARNMTMNPGQPPPGVPPIPHQFSVADALSNSGKEHAVLDKMHQTSQDNFAPPPGAPPHQGMAQPPGAPPGMPPPGVPPQQSSVNFGQPPAGQQRDPQRRNVGGFGLG